MIERRIFTEQPEEEMWRSILHFSYTANIKKYLDEHNYSNDDNLIECISGSILQAYEYYISSKNANLQISPLLLYYGTTNLFYGITNLITGKINEIKNHGMYLEIESIENFIAEALIGFENYEKGGIHIFCKALGITIDLTKYGKWSIQELLGSISEIHDDYYSCYSSKDFFIIPIQEIKTESGIIEKVILDKYDVDTFSTLFSQVSEVEKSYLKPSLGNDINGDQFIILRHKINAKTIAEISYSQQPYLQVAHKKNGSFVTLPELFYMYIILFALGSLCRYNPEKWNPFVRNDLTGEKLLVEKFLYFARRIIPNMILNTLYDCQMNFVNEKYRIIETIKVVSEHEVKEIIKKELDLRERLKEVRKYGI
jgi:hypothetical protein